MSGDADGNVEIIALDATTYQVKDKGVIVGTAEAVNDDIRIQINAEAEANNQVTLDFAGQSVDKVMADLGDGDNGLVIKGGTIKGSLKFVGGGADDTLEIAADAVVQKSVFAQLGEGENTVMVEGRIGRDLFVRGGSEDDSVAIVAGAHVERGVHLDLGDGDNRTQSAAKLAVSSSSTQVLTMTP